MRLLIRADATPRIGTGHVMRCVAIAEAWREAGGEAIFLTTGPRSAVFDRVSTQFDVVWIESRGEYWANTGRTDRILLDGYHFDSEYQQSIKALGLPLAIIDDNAHLPHYYANIIINPNPGADRLPYSCEPGTRLLAGPDYALLRSEFRGQRGWKREIPAQVRRILVTFGGSDPDNVTSMVIRALRDVTDTEIVVVAGAANPHLERLHAQISSIPSARLEVGVSDMAKVMRQADLAITAAGSTCWELACLQTPMIAIVIAENQQIVSAGLAAAGAAVTLGDAASLHEDEITAAVDALRSDRVRRSELAARAGRLVDGMGAIRVVNALKSM